MCRAVLHRRVGGSAQREAARSTWFRYGRCDGCMDQTSKRGYQDTTFSFSHCLFKLSWHFFFFFLVLKCVFLQPPRRRCCRSFFTTSRVFPTSLGNTLKAKLTSTHQRSQRNTSGHYGSKWHLNIKIMRINTNDQRLTSWTLSKALSHISDESVFPFSTVKIKKEHYWPWSE